MKRTKLNNNVESSDNVRSNRRAIATSLGITYNGDRDLYAALGYKKLLTIEDYASMYSRGEVAAALINKPTGKTWKGELHIQAITDDPQKKDQLKERYGALSKELKLKDAFLRLDRLSTLGEYGILFLGFNDVGKSTEIKLHQPVRPFSGLQLLYVSPYGQDKVTINAYDTDVFSSRYGLPLTYNILQDQGNSLLVHYSRVIHVTGERLDSEVLGIPYLQRVFNRIQDIEKIAGSDAEAYYRNVRPGFSGKADENHELDSSGQTATSLENQMKEYDHNLRRVILTEGIDLNPLSQSMADPYNHIKIQLQLISAYTEIPNRILMGSEVADVSSTQDRNNWLDFIEDRRSEFAEPQIVRPFVDRLMSYQILPKMPYQVVWPDLYVTSESDKVDLATKKVNILTTYANSIDAQTIVPPSIFLRLFMAMDEADLISVEEELRLLLDSTPTMEDEDDV